MGQFAFDIAGNFYFTDTNNNRVRRIDGATGIIHTIAGNGTVGSAGDGGPATSAHLNAPTGVAVDSQGQVYIISGTTSPTAQSVRKVGTNGDLVFPGQLKGTASAANLVTVANSGNSELEITNTTITGTNKGDFSIDPNTTNCLLTTGSSLNAGQSCQIGVIFKPSASGTRTASLTLLDNTVNNSNTVLLSGTGTLPAPTFKITAPASGASFTYGSTVKFSVSVTSASGAAPTGTVKFSVDGTAFGSPVTVASGAASINLTGLSVKTHTISAAYSGDANYAAASTSESIIVAKAMPAFKITAPAAGASFTSGTTVKFTVSVTSSSGAAPTGTVKFSVDGTAFGSAVTVASGAASINLTGLSVKAHTISAAYSGDGNYVSATASESITVTAAAVKSAVQLSSKANPAVSSKPISFFALVETKAGSEPQGTVKLIEGKTMLAKSSLKDGIADFTVTKLSAGTHLVIAEYSGTPSTRRQTQLSSGRWSSSLARGALRLLARTERAHMGAIGCTVVRDRGGATPWATSRVCAKVEVGLVVNNVHFRIAAPSSIPNRAPRPAFRSASRGHRSAWFTHEPVRDK